MDLTQTEDDLPELLEELQLPGTGEAGKVVTAIPGKVSNVPIHVYEVLHQKEIDFARVRHEIGSLQIVASLLSDELSPEELTRKRARSSEEASDPGSERATGTGDLFSSSRSWHHLIAWVRDLLWHNHFVHQPQSRSIPWR
jgi:hypothetical protein